MRRVVSRILLLALAVAVGVAVWRVAGGGRGGAVVALDGLHADELAHQAFRLRAPARLAVDAAGSFEERRAGRPDSALAAYGWVVRRSDRAVVWRQRAGARPARGLVATARDTVRLPTGEYDAYFASYGDPLAAPDTADAAGATLRGRLREALARGGRAWQGEAGRWHLRLAGATPADRALATALDDADAEATAGVVWQSGPVGSRRRTSALLRVSADARVTVDAVLEAADGVVADSAVLVRVGAVPDTVWAFGRGATTWAGGSVKNRAQTATLRLAPGLYRAAVRTDGTHAWGGWTANPPSVPAAWGMRVALAEPAEAGRGAAERVAVVDVPAIAAEVRAGTSRLPVLAEMRCVGTSQTRAATFTLAGTTAALVVAQGELDHDDAFDAATLVRNGRPLWTMDYRDSEHAGGEDRNRHAARTLVLPPGAYTLRFRTDDSHDCKDGYSSGSSPDDAAFWGAAVVALDPAFDLRTVGRVASVDEPGSPAVLLKPPVPPTPPVPPVPPAGTMDEPRGTTLADLAPVGPSTHRVARFELYTETRVRVVATGELLASERLDWGWIQTEAGERVWEMTRANTVPAGGAAKNRRFDGVLTLEPGQYRVAFRTNARHDADGFDDAGAPDDPAAWGVRVERLGG